MLAIIQNGIQADSADERAAALESLVAILETRGHELTPDGLDEFADVLTQLLRSLPPDLADRSAHRLNAALSGKSAAPGDMGAHDLSAPAPQGTTAPTAPTLPAPTLTAPMPTAPMPAATSRSESLALLMALAHEPRLDMATTHRIVSRGNDAARLAVVRNPGAQFARSTLTTLAELAISDLGLKEALAARPDLPEGIGDRLWPFLSDKARVSLLTARRHEALADFAALAAQENDDGHPPVDALAADIAAGTTPLATVISGLVQEGRLVTAGIVLARAAGLSDICGAHAILSPAERPLIVLLRFMGADADLLADIIRLRARCGIGASKDSRFAAILLDDMPQAEAAGLARLMSSQLAMRFAAPPQDMRASA